MKAYLGKWRIEKREYINQNTGARMARLFLAYESYGIRLELKNGVLNSGATLYTQHFFITARQGQLIRIEEFDRIMHSPQCWWDGEDQTIEKAAGLHLNFALGPKAPKIYALLEMLGQAVCFTEIKLNNHYDKIFIHIETVKKNAVVFKKMGLSSTGTIHTTREEICLPSVTMKYLNRLLLPVHTDDTRTEFVCPVSAHEYLEYVQNLIDQSQNLVQNLGKWSVPIAEKIKEYTCR